LRYIVLVELVYLGAIANAAQAATFTIDQARSMLVVQLFRDGVAARLGHDHVVRATRFSGLVSFDPTAPQSATIRVDVDAAGLKADEPSTRSRFSVSGTPTASDIAEIETSMKSERQLYVSRFPRITFASDRITREASGRYQVAGRLTIRGVTQAVRFPATVRMEGDVVRATATIEFLQTSFGFQPYRAALGAIKNKDAVKLHVDLTATPQ
jgi:polyisoprenoid-binding protein YceI